ncbi:hypothetical protein HYX14_00310 [Candidatus Woesearchaeota archaeon]|nr:hypothetical protein [Candidatus Woesearchaeota archaeon]
MAGKETYIGLIEQVVTNGVGFTEKRERSAENALELHYHLGELELAARSRSATGSRRRIVEDLRELRSLRARYNGLTYDSLQTVERALQVWKSQDSEEYTWQPILPSEVGSNVPAIVTAGTAFVVTDW